VVVTNPEKQRVVTSYEGEILIKSSSDKNAAIAARLQVPLGAILMVEDGSDVKRDQVIFTWDPYTNPILADVDGTVRFVDIVEDESVSEELDELTGLRQRVIIEDREKKLHPHIEIIQEKGGKEKRVRDFIIPAGAQLTVEDGQKIFPGTIIAKVGREAYKTRDITGGLPRVAELFEARRPKDPATISRSTAWFGSARSSAVSARSSLRRSTTTARSTRRARRSCTKSAPASTCECTKVIACAPVIVCPRVRSIRTTFCGSRDPRRCRSICSTKSRRFTASRA
jgi:hypothetical protein